MQTDRHWLEGAFDHYLPLTLPLESLISTASNADWQLSIRWDCHFVTIQNDMTDFFGVVPLYSCLYPLWIKSLTCTVCVCLPTFGPSSQTLRGQGEHIAIIMRWYSVFDPGGKEQELRRTLQQETWYTLSCENTDCTLIAYCLHPACISEVLNQELNDWSYLSPDANFGLLSLWASSP